MVSINFFLADGSLRSVDAAAGRSVMQAAVSQDVPGIVGECGGNAMCATCHVYVDVDSASSADLPAVSDLEDEMLDCTVAPRRDSSRLSCQLKVVEEWDGLSVRLPDRQL